ncbi:MFS transporter [Bifidobacterium sp. SMB2]|uniref:MFS transporter n=1 Tax=Bifidobacterium saimiriisciurei TaxID=2661627 RepID=A0ABX0CAU8_9BIFI|nr:MULTISPECIES: MFS transporter [Bifidobacterium]NEG95252.1 MFS transporter [Bifidobacterium sp. SMB2]NEH11329.1 MFS transporter [Bifidobacterium saimiriisciurei]
MIRLFEKFGIPRTLLLGFLAVAIFMTGDGFELTFLSKYMVDQGFTASQASLLVTVYGLFAALGGWTAGVLAEMFGARRVMMFGACWWIGVHLVFLGLALPSGIYPFILGIYAVRGIGYPLFIYSFVVLMAQYIPPARLASATGFFWTCFSLGIGVFGAYLPSYIMPHFGEYRTFWFALPFSIVGTIMCFFCVPKNKVVKGDGLSTAEKLKELTDGATILFTNRKIAICAVIRIINNLLLYGFPVIMPLYLCTTKYGGINIFKTEEWMRIWGFVFVVTLIFNTFWGWFMDRFGWVWPMRWFGCGVLAVGSVLFYYMPRWFGPNTLMMIVASIVVGIGTCAFSCLPTIMTLEAPDKQGAALSAYNLAAGLTTFVGPGIATVLLPVIGIEGICWTYAALYVVALLLTFTLHPKQPGFDEKGRRIPGARTIGDELVEEAEQEVTLVADSSSESESRTIASGTKTTKVMATA